MSEKLSNSAAKLIKSLQQKKYRDLNGLFLVEGVKLTEEALRHNQGVEKVIYSGDKSNFHFSLPENAISVSPKELEILSGQKTPNRILAVCRKFSEETHITRLSPTLVLDGVADPGNLGTIIRLCDWFGFSQLICSNESVDLYNPKVVQASMGSLFRVKVIHTDLQEFIGGLPEGKKIYGADMHGTSIYDVDFEIHPVVVFGSESHGINDKLKALMSEKISIPQTGGGESLNVAVSAAIISSEIRRRFPTK